MKNLMVLSWYHLSYHINLVKFGILWLSMFFGMTYNLEQSEYDFII